MSPRHNTPCRLLQQTVTLSHTLKLWGPIGVGFWVTYCAVLAAAGYPLSYPVEPWGVLVSFPDPSTTPAIWLSNAGRVPTVTLVGSDQGTPSIKLNVWSVRRPACESQGSLKNSSFILARSWASYFISGIVVPKRYC